MIGGKWKQEKEEKYNPNVEEEIKFFLFAILEGTLCKINGFFGYSSFFIFVVKFIIPNDDYYNSCK
jgi:hypothetical protein